jgi:small-conductance mechanosensitive channel
MKTTKQIATLTLIVLLVVIGYGIFRTSQSISALPMPSADKQSQAQASVVDQASLYTARHFAQMPTSTDELPLAKEALRLGDREMDLAFAARVHELQEHPPTLSPQAKESQTRLQEAQNSLDRDNAHVAELTSALAKATGARADSRDDQLQQAKVQAELDQDEVDNAKQELALAGGDTQGRIEELMKEHEAASHVADSTTVNTATPATSHGLIHHYQAWSRLHDKALELRQASRDTESAALAFTTRRDGLKSASGPPQKQQAPGTPAGGTASGANSTTAAAETSTEIVRATKRRSAVLKELTNLNERIEDQNHLAGTYRKWIDVVAAKQRSVIHRGLFGPAVIVAILLIGIFFDSLLKHLLRRVKLDQRQADTLHAVISTGVQIIALGLILLVIFGPPTQLGTFLGLAGAGLTVALKDFIVSFFGWFVLMGRNGIRIGDWVEINGVTGEVVELGMFHTVLLETGNWTDSGHPTGRRVTFTNNFAIEGHYFNFSTSGQWLWDELSLVLPSSQNPYPIVESIQKTVLEATSETKEQAEKEWQHAAHSREMRTLSAAPAINLKPVSGGVEVAVRYITRASERYQLRARLYQAAMNLIGKKEPHEPVSISEREGTQPT